MAHDPTTNQLMGPVLEWPKDQGPSPVCGGTCNGRNGWRHVNGISLCGTCGKPSHGYLKLCEICETVYLYDPNDLSKYRIQDFNPTMPRVLPHAACAKALEEMSNGN